MRCNINALPPHRATTLAVLAALVLPGGWLAGAPPVDAGGKVENGLIAFSSNRGGGEIFTVSPRGETKKRRAKRLTHVDGDGFAVWPDWSPDGSKIAFEVYSSPGVGPSEIFVMDADGSDQTQLTNNDALDSFPAWSPDGTKIAFESRRDGNNEIYVMDADGSDQTRLTVSAANSVFGHVWSPDGTKIAFWAGDSSFNYHLTVMGADGSNQTVLNADTCIGLPFSWSPDSGRIAFLTCESGSGGIFTIDADGGNLTRLSNDGSNPAWSPDGTKIAFMTTRHGGRFEIYVMDADGANETRLTRSRTSETALAWSPDGTKIVFVLAQGNSHIFVMNADGSHQKALTTRGGSSQPAWQPKPA